jgi:hypothetical protein
MDNNFFVIVELLRSDGSIIINKALARNIGLNESILYSELLSKFIYFSKKNMLDNDGYFFNTIENIEEDTTLTKKQQGPAIKKLEELGLINKKLMGCPPKRYFKIVQNFKLITKYLSKNTNESIDKSKKEQKVTFKGYKKSPLKVTKGNTNNTNINNTNINKTTTDEKEKNVVVDEAFINDFIEKFESKYNTKIHKKRLLELYIKSGEDKINKYFNNFESFVKTEDIDDIARYFYKAVSDEYTIPVIKNKKIKNNKPSQTNNYQQRSYSDDYWDSLYENI